MARLIPIPAILTPATLSIVSSPIDPIPTHMIKVPSIDFESLKFTAAGICNDFQPPENVTVCWYNGPQYAVRRIVNSVASHGHILPIVPPAPNSSWTMEFQGPKLSCDDVGSPHRESILDNIFSAYPTSWADRLNERMYHLSPVPNYLSWTPQYANGTIYYGYNSALNVLPYDLDSLKKEPIVPIGLVPSSWAPIGPYLMAQGFESAVASIFFAAIPPILSVAKNAEVRAAMAQNATIIQCKLMNATYHVSLEYVEGTQNITVDFPNPAAMNPVGAIEGFHLGVSSEPSIWKSIQSMHGEYKHSVLQRLSFQSIMQAFGEGKLALVPRSRTRC